MHNVSKLPAKQAYATRYAEVMEALQELPVLMKHAPLASAEPHWGHVGSLTRALQLAQELRDLLRGEVK